jgi:hypothetical protein
LGLLFQFAPYLGDRRLDEPTTPTDLPIGPIRVAAQEARGERPPVIQCEWGTMCGIERKGQGVKVFGVGRLQNGYGDRAESSF